MITVGFTRPEDRLEDTVRDAEAMGLTPVAFPSMTVVPVPDENFTRVEELLSSGDVWYTLFASVTAVNEVVNRYGPERTADLLSRTKVACTGPFTADRLKLLTGRECDLVPKVYSGEGVAAELSQFSKDRKVLLLRSAKGDNGVDTAFESAGAEVIDVPVYATVPAKTGPMHLEFVSRIEKREVDAVLFTSPKSYRIVMDLLVEHMGREQAYDAVGHVLKVSIGMTTTKAMVADGVPPDAVSEVSSLKSMFETVRARFGNQS